MSNTEEIIHRIERLHSDLKKEVFSDEQILASINTVSCNSIPERCLASAMETEEDEPVIDEFKVEVEEEEIASTFGDDPLSLSPQTPVWGEEEEEEEEDSEASIGCLLNGAEEGHQQVPHEIQVQMTERRVTAILPEDPLAIPHQQSLAWEEANAKLTNNLFASESVSRYLENLPEEQRQQYFSKLVLKSTNTSLPDPYKITGWVYCMEEWPDLNNGHIHQYLLCGQGPLTCRETASVSMEGYEAFKHGNVLAVEYNPISSALPVCFLKAKVVPPCSVIADPHEPWVCLEKEDGSVRASHCTCLSQFNVVCSHIAGLLFKVEAAVALGMNKEDSDSCSSKHAVWNKFYSNRICLARVKDITFTHRNSSKGQRRAFKQLKPQPLSEAKQKEALAELRKILPDASVFLKDESDTDTASEGDREEEEEKEEVAVLSMHNYAYRAAAIK